MKKMKVMKTWKAPRIVCTSRVAWPQAFSVDANFGCGRRWLDSGFDADLKCVHVQTD